MQPVSPIGPDGLTDLREILMVEDNEADAELALRTFKHANFSNPVTVVASGEQAVDYLFGTGVHAAKHPQLIFLDLNLPKMPGLRFMHCIKGDRRTRDIPVIVLTHSAHDRDVAACVQLGAEAY